MTAPLREYRARLWSLRRYGETLPQLAGIELWRFRILDLEITCTAGEVELLGSTYVRALLFDTNGVDLSGTPRIIWSDPSKCYGWTAAALSQCEAAGCPVWCFTRRAAA